MTNEYQAGLRQRKSILKNNFYPLIKRNFQILYTQFIEKPVVCEGLLFLRCRYNSLACWCVRLSPTRVLSLTVYSLTCWCMRLSPTRVLSLTVYSLTCWCVRLSPTRVLSLETELFSSSSRGLCSCTHTHTDSTKILRGQTHTGSINSGQFCGSASC